MELELLCGKAKGVARDEKLLFVHGICVGGWIWEEHFFPYFTDAGYDCYALSLRGHGKSDGYDQIKTWTLSDYTQDLETIASKIEGPLIVIGHSLGGAVVQNWVRTGGKPKAMALLASTPPWGLSYSAWKMALTNPFFYQEIAKLNMFGIEATDRNLIAKGLYSDLDSINDKDFERYMKNTKKESAIVGMQLQGLVPIAPLPWQAPPTYVQGAANDSFIPQEEVCRTAAYYGCKPAIIPNLSHAVMVDTNWQDSAESLKCWLSAKV